MKIIRLKINIYEWIEKGREIVDLIEEISYQRNSDASENSSN